MSFGLVANLAALMTFAATLSETAGEWRLSASQSGWIGGIYFAGYGVAVPFLASASDRMDGRRLYVASALIRAAANFACSLPRTSRGQVCAGLVRRRCQHRWLDRRLFGDCARLRGRRVRGMAWLAPA